MWGSSRVIPDLYLPCTSYLLQLSIYQKQNRITWYFTTLLDIVPEKTWFCNGVWLWIPRKTGEWRSQCILHGKLTITVGRKWIGHEMVKASSGMVGSKLNRTWDGQGIIRNGLLVFNNMIALSNKATKGCCGVIHRLFCSTRTIISGLFMRWQKS
jgi:hypothetical protein